jgi:hypothetical protein
MMYIVWAVSAAASHTLWEKAGAYFLRTTMNADLKQATDPSRTLNNASTCDYHKHQHPGGLETPDASRAIGMFFIYFYFFFYYTNDYIFTY